MEIVSQVPECNKTAEKRVESAKNGLVSFKVIHDFMIENQQLVDDR